MNTHTKKRRQKQQKKANFELAYSYIYSIKNMNDKGYVLSETAH